jgi:hypothetical protein
MSASVTLNFGVVHYRCYLSGWVAASGVHVAPPSAEDSEMMAAYALGIRDAKTGEPIADFSSVASKVTKLLSA